jgi:type IV pilus assembly protein PilY1
MLHAFREDTGAEVFAYVPDYLIGKLNQLTSADYEHTWYVDGPMDYGDVYYNNAWKSVLVGTLRSGGQAVYALDITDPLNFSASDVLWEFSDIDDVDMGYVVGRPQIRKMANGKWAVIFGSGYNSPEADGEASATGDAYVFVLFIEDGIDGWSAADYVKIPVPGADGLTSPAVADVDGDSMADFLYLGDLNGNMWKIDVTSATPGSWSVAFSGNPLFTATSPTGGLQPITSRPSVKTHPYGISHGALILFGTGKYLEITDDVVDGRPTQSVYAIWDRDAYFHRTPDTGDTDPRNNYGEYGFARSSLTTPDIEVDAASGNRIIDPNTFAAPEWYDTDGNVNNRGWVADLPITGERIIQRTVIRDDLVYFVTMIPEPDVCTPGSTGWLMVLDAQTGGSPLFPVFDINNDLIVDSDDMLTVGDQLDPTQTGASGVAMPSMPNLPLFVYEDKPAGAASGWSNFPPTPNASRGCSTSGARTFTYTTQADGSITMIVSASQPLVCGRQSWMQYE